MKIKLLAIALLSSMIFAGCSGEKTEKPDERVFCFYYNWYGNVKTDGEEIHWSHNIIGNDSYDGPLTRIPGGEDLASNFYPQLGDYSSKNPEVIAKHVEMMAKADIGVIVVTWWGKNDIGTPSLPTLFDEAAKHDIKICFHIEPYSGRSAESVRDNIKALIDEYGSKPAFYKMNGKPCFFVYDSYLIPSENWARVLSPDGDQTIRGTNYDSIVIGLWVKENDGETIADAGFDGFYTYFGSDGFTYGSTSSNWKSMEAWAEANGKIFIPCVGPGYNDTRIRPWNVSTTRDRENGKYYQRMFGAAISSGAKHIGITSFNEWHEGTQIEPAIPMKCEAYTYLDYSPLESDWYLNETRRMIREWNR